MKYLTKATLLRIRARKRDDFLSSDFFQDRYLTALAPDATLLVLFAMRLCRRARESLEDLMRIFVEIPNRESGEDDLVIIDVPVRDYDALPETAGQAA